MADTRSRMLALLSLLQGGRSHSGAELARRLDTSPRTLRRDIERLRQLGYPVTTVRGPGGHYRLSAGAAMPPLLLDDDEAIAIALGLRLAADGSVSDIADTAANALRKVEQVLPGRLRPRLRAMHAATETTVVDRPQVTAELLHIVGEAGHRRQLLDFDYRDRDEIGSRRRVEPYRQVLVNRRWYLLAFDRDRADWRIFRMDRIGEVSVLPGQFPPREPPADTAVSYVEAALGSYPPRHRLVVDFAAPFERVASRMAGREGELEPLDAEHCRYRVEADSYEWMAIMLAVSGFDYRIVAPHGFIEYSRELARRVTAATDHEGDPP